MRKVKLPLTVCSLLVATSATVFVSCSTMSNEQLSAVQKFGTACDSFSRYPSLLFEEIADIRIASGLYYAATISDPNNRIEELNEIHNSYRQDITLAKKCDKSLEILKTYSKSLRVLTNDGRWEARGREFRTLGRALDSLIVEVNNIGIFREKLPERVGKSAGVVAAYGAEKMLKNRQHKLAREFIYEADTLVQALITSLVDILRLPEVSALIENEKNSLKANYTAFLLASKLAETEPTIENDKNYIALYERNRQLTYSRGYIIAAANRLAKSHAGIAESLQKGRSVSEVYKLLVEFTDTVDLLTKEFKSIKR